MRARSQRRIGCSATPRWSAARATSARAGSGLPVATQTGPPQAWPPPGPTAIASRAAAAGTSAAASDASARARSRSAPVRSTSTRGALPALNFSSAIVATRAASVAASASKRARSCASQRSSHASVAFQRASPRVASTSNPAASASERAAATAVARWPKSGIGRLTPVPRRAVSRAVDSASVGFASAPATSTWARAISSRPRASATSGARASGGVARRGQRDLGRPLGRCRGVRRGDRNRRRPEHERGDHQVARGPPRMHVAIVIRRG